MRSTKKVSAAFLLASLTIGILGIDASALTPVTKATKVAVVTTPTTATITWAAFAKGKVTGIKIVAANGSKAIKKITRSASATSKSYRFTGLYPNSSYSFSVYGVKGASSSAAVVVRARTQVLKYDNTIFFGQPDDMLIGEANQKLSALSDGGKTSFSSSTPAVCQVVKAANVSYLRAVAAGACTVIARNPGDKQYEVARDVVRKLSVYIPWGSFDKTLLWSEEFDGAVGEGPSTDNWVIETGDGCPDLCNWGNEESQAYAACAIKKLGNGIMRITASREETDPYCITDTNKRWTSGKFTTFGKKHFTYGYFEARMKMPEGIGTWPAFWALGSNIKTVPWPKSGELDIMEYAGNRPKRSTSAAHYQKADCDPKITNCHEYKTGYQNHLTDLSSEFNTYGMLWTPNKVSFYFNGEIFWDLKKSETGLARWPFGPTSAGVHPKMYLILNLAMGGTYGGPVDSSLTNATFDIDYVRYYSKDGYGSAPTN
jgi:hypothetical protein